MVVVYRYRVKSRTGLLNAQAQAVNVVWNFCNQTQREAKRRMRPSLSGFDLDRLTTGTSKILGLHSGTINAVTAQYVNSRRAHKRSWLRWRGEKALGWVPLKGRDLHEESEAFRFNGVRFRVFKSRDLPSGATIKDGTNFSRDTRGRWYLNVVIEIPEGVVRTEGPRVGIDLGLKTFATLSTGATIEHTREYRTAEARLAILQRAKKRRQIKRLHDRIANRRRDAHHKASTALVQEFAQIAVGNVPPRRLTKTRFAKSVLDAGWSSFRSMLAYKAIKHGARYLEVDERLTSQICSACGALPASRPTGIADLGIRRWTCSDCGADLDRDVNAARNIVVSGFGREALALGIPSL